MGLAKRLLQPLLRFDLENRRCRDAFLALHEGLEAKSLLDVGCGDGAETEELARRVGAPLTAVHGAEFHPPHLAAAQKRFHAFRHDAEMDRLPLDDGAVELVALNQILEHLKNVFLCLAEAERVLKVGGRLSIGVPNLAALVPRIQLLVGVQPSCMRFPGPHIRGFSYREFKRFLRMNPAFEIERERGAVLYPFPWPLTDALAAPLPRWATFMFFRLRKREHRARSAWLDARRGETFYPGL